ncbi:glycogen synthase [Patescibacteria group bacterium]|nr:glycogen synthase [Patescibacteria group bacterium]MBU1922467.1 glycogen synthase [Patescibacteria group bacterium]
MAKDKIKILFCTYECAPFFKRGGLGDVALGLPRALSALGHEVKVVMPKYRYINARQHKLKIHCRNVPVAFGPKKEKIKIYRANLPKSRAVAYFIDHRIFHSANIFDKNSLRRFIFFNKCVLDFIKHDKWKPDVIHANDWHTGALFVYLRKLKKQDFWYRKIGTLHTIHNLAFQGVGVPDFEKIGLGPDDFLNKKQVNFMSEAILGADMINTVSQTYAKEILTKEFGRGMEIFLRKREKRLHGIVNGLDKEYFNPAQDPELPYRYSLKSIYKKKLNKAELQKRAKLPVADVPVISIISRLATQKGFDLILQAMPRLLEKRDIQFVALGHGSPEITKALHAMEKKYKKRARAFTFFGPSELAKLIYAGSDIFLMPSRFEPCGLGQLISMRYGTVPVARQTGGLNDTIEDIKSKGKVKGTGFLFKAYQAPGLEKTISRALAYYKKPALWKQIQANGMRLDSAWPVSAEEYVKLYKKIIKKYASRN